MKMTLVQFLQKRKTVSPDNQVLGNQLKSLSRAHLFKRQSVTVFGYQISNETPTYWTGV